MARLTKEQIERMNQQLHNGFQFDDSYYCYHKREKTAEKTIELDNHEWLQVRLRYMTIYNEDFKDTGLKKPCIHLQVFKRGEYGIKQRFGYGQSFGFGEARKAKNWSYLAKFSKNLDDSLLLDMVRKNYDKLHEGPLH